MCKFYSLSQYEQKGKYSAIKSIKIIVQSKSENLYFQIFRDESKNKGKLPKTKIDNVPFNEGEYSLICIDDEIYYIPENAKRISLKEWFHIK